MALEPFRQAFSQTTRQGIFFDNASMGPVIPAVTQAMARCMELRQAMPMKYYRYAEELFPACRGRCFGGFRRFLFLLFFAHLKSPYFLVTTPTVLRAPLRVRAFVLVLCPRTGRPLAWRSPR